MTATTKMDAAIAAWRESVNEEFVEERVINGMDRSLMDCAGRMMMELERWKVLALSASPAPWRPAAEWSDVGILHRLAAVAMVVYVDVLNRRPDEQRGLNTAAWLDEPRVGQWHESVVTQARTWHQRRQPRQPIVTHAEALAVLQQGVDKYWDSIRERDHRQRQNRWSVTTGAVLDMGTAALTVYLDLIALAALPEQREESTGDADE